jgi:cysteine desulfurase
MAEVGGELDLISISGHKVYAPKGIGVLTVRRRRPRVRLAPQMLGGGQQRGLRAGTMPVALAVALGEACALAQAEVQSDGARLTALRGRLWERLSHELDGVRVNGDLRQRLPGNLNVSFDGVEAESLLLELKWIALSSGSACASAEKRPSHVLEAIGLPNEAAHASMRFGLGRFSTADEVERVADAVVATVRRMRAATPSLARATGR